VRLQPPTLNQHGPALLRDLGYAEADIARIFAAT
jgi:hypothetical protein